MSDKRMLHIRLAVFAGLLSLGISLFAQSAATYPARLGTVNDFAGKLDESQARELTGLIRHYEGQTSVEFVIVIADSLGGQSAREYAIGIGNFWRIGKAGRNNGIVLLWAPTERAYSLRIADGLSPDLSDSDATLITRQNLLPNFRREEYYTGLKETVLATMEHLGNTSWNKRLQARAHRAEEERTLQQQRAEQEREAEIQREELRTRQMEEERKAQESLNTNILRFFLILAGIAVIGTAIYRSRRRKARLAEMAEAESRISEYLHTAEMNATETQALLDDFAREMPEQDISAIRNDLARQPERIARIKSDLQYLNFTELSTYDEIVRTRTAAATEANLLESAREQTARIRDAKERSQGLMNSLAHEDFEILEVRDESRRVQVDQLLSQGREDYLRARQSSSMSIVDWLLINELLNSSQDQVQRAVQCSQEIPYVAPQTFDNNSNSSYSSSSFFGGDGGSDSSSSSGGGSGFSSGSGSDGTY